VFWWIAWSIDYLKMACHHIFLYWGYFSSKLELLPLDLHYWVERMNLFLILSLGEVISASLAGVSHHNEQVSSNEEEENDENYDSLHSSPVARVATVVLLSGFLKLLLFDLNPEPAPSGLSLGNHALSRSVVSGVLWNYSVVPMNAAIVILGAVLEPIQAGESINKNYTTSICVALAVLLLLLLCQDLLHDQGVKIRRISFRYRLAGSLLFIILILFFSNLGDPQHWLNYPYRMLGYIVVIVFCNVSFTFYSHLPPKDLDMKAILSLHISSQSISLSNDQNTVDKDVNF